MKTKTLTAVEIAIVLCSMLVVAMPAIAAEQDDYALGIYGNANEDDTIDMRDVTYTKLVIFGKKPETELADAYYDDEVDVLDVVQTKLIILGRESELTVVDIAGRTVTLNKPVNAMAVLHCDSPVAIRALGATDKVVGVGDLIKERPMYYPELSKLPSVGLYGEPDVEMIIALGTDLVIEESYLYPSGLPEILEVAGIQILYFNLVGQPYYTQEVRQLGYILDKRNEADEFIDFTEECVSTITERVEGLLEEDKPRVYYEGWDDYITFGKENTERGVLITLAGGINIAGDLPGEYPTVESEWVVDRNPSIILKSTYTGWPPDLLCGYEYDDPSSMKAFRETIMDRPGLKTTDAVKEEKVSMIAAEIACGYYPIGLRYMARLFHPDLFKDLDPEAFHQDFLTEFQGLDYDLDEHGVFVYPPIEVDGGLAGIPERYKEQI
jgi:iron complex transport system substrate-binding protein